MFTIEVMGRLIEGLDCAPWSAGSGCAARVQKQAMVRPLYSPQEKLRRDETPWTLVQGVLAPVQFFVFLISLALVSRYLITGDGLDLANWSIVAKTLILYTIMITGAIWERVVFGRYLFAPAFYWEDMVSMLVLTLHTIYLYALFTDAMQPIALMGLALVAYGTYVVNAMQFVMKLRAARKQAEWMQASMVGAGR